MFLDDRAKDDNASLKQRQKQRAYRKEYQLILKRCNQIGFQYIINRPPPARVCFGSSIGREVVPKTGPAISSFMRRITEEGFKYPFRFQAANRQWSCTGGYGLMASKTPRFPSKGNETVMSTSIETPPAVRRNHINRGGFGGPRRECRKKIATPGVGTYDLSVTRKQVIRASFGGKIRHKPATITLCAPEQRDRCQNCKTTPTIDYWKHFRLDKCYCRSCMQVEIDYCNAHSRSKFLKIKRLKLLREYERVRYCGDFVHKHEKTRAFLQILPQSEVVRKIRRENYLSMFYM